MVENVPSGQGNCNYTINYGTEMQPRTPLLHTPQIETHLSSSSVSARPEYWWNRPPAGQLVKHLAFYGLPAWLLEGIKAGPLGYRNGGHGWIYWVAFWLYFYRLRHRLADNDIRALLRRGPKATAAPYR